MRLIDSHCHLDDPVFETDLNEVCRHAREAGITDIIVPAITARHWPRIRQLTQSVSFTHPAYGLHPMFLEMHKPEDINELETWIARESIIAIGECGLDYYSHKHTRRQQQQFFDAQLALAHQAGLPVIVHARKSVEEALLMIRRYPGLTGVFHSFSGSIEQAKRLIDLGFFLGFGGPATWPNSHRIHKVIQQAPLDAILLETDAPDQPDAKHRGQRNEPAFLQDIAPVIAQLKDISTEQLAEAASANTARLFSL